MKYILLLLVLSPLASLAQRDFDYEFYTQKAKIAVSDSSDSLTVLPWPRHIEKHADVLRIVNPENTGDCITFRLHFIGLSWGKGTDMAFVYTAADTQDLIYINPVFGILSINKRNTYY